VSESSPCISLLSFISEAGNALHFISEAMDCLSHFIIQDAFQDCDSHDRLLMEFFRVDLGF
jgi:hypothetical protein